MIHIFGIPKERVKSSFGSTAPKEETVFSTHLLVLFCFTLSGDLVHEVLVGANEPYKLSSHWGAFKRQKQAPENNSSLQKSAEVLEVERGEGQKVTIQSGWLVGFGKSSICLIRFRHAFLSFIPWGEPLQTAKHYIPQVRGRLFSLAAWISVFIAEVTAGPSCVHKGGRVCVSVKPPHLFSICKSAHMFILGFL